MALGRHDDTVTLAASGASSASLISSVLAYIFWNRGVAQVGANVAGLFVHLMPVFGVVLAWMFLDGAASRRITWVALR